MTLDLGIPFPQAMKLTRYAVMWDSSIHEYDACKIDVVRSLFDGHIADLTAMPWSDADIDAVLEMEASNEMQEAVKADLLKIAETSLEGQKDE
jgi:predicted DNA-binding transcriptional regulator AlpA